MDRLVSAMIQRDLGSLAPPLPSSAWRSKKPSPSRPMSRRCTPRRQSRAKRQTPSMIDGLTVVDTARTTRLDNFTVVMKPGEIVGVAGVEGNGQSELGLALAGHDADQRRPLLRRRHRTHPREPEGDHRGGRRHRAGGSPSRRLHPRHVALPRTSISTRPAASPASALLDRRAMRRDGRRADGALRRARAGAGVAFASLSGGNQQKAVLAREMVPENLVFLVAAQPTRGLDVGAVEAVYRPDPRGLRARRRGAADLLRARRDHRRRRPHPRHVSRQGHRRAAGRRRTPRRDRRNDGGARANDRRCSRRCRPRRGVQRPQPSSDGMPGVFAAGGGRSPPSLRRPAPHRRPRRAAGQGDRRLHQRRLRQRPTAIAASLNRAVVFALVGLGFIIANRANLTNVGGEGQIAMGGIAAAAVAIYGGVADLPLGLAFILPMLGGAVAGAAWGGIAGVLQGQGRHQRGDLDAAAVVHRGVDALLVRSSRRACCAGR